MYSSKYSICTISFNAGNNHFFGETATQFSVEMVAIHGTQSVPCEVSLSAASTLQTVPGLAALSRRPQLMHLVTTSNPGGKRSG